jgi:hypothetical protein
LGEAPANSLIKVEGAAGDTIACAQNHRRTAFDRPSPRRGQDFAMRGIKSLLTTPFERRMRRDQGAVFEYPDGIGEYVNVQDTPARRIRHAIEIAAYTDHAFV